MNSQKLSTSKKINVCIVTYETLPNPISQNLKKFLLNNYSTNLLYIAHPMLEIKESYEMSSQYLFFTDNWQTLKHKAYHWILPAPVLYIKDVLYTLFWCIRFGKRWDIYFAAGNLNPVAGIILREIGVVKKVVYQCLDYFPTRFENKILNWLYFHLDKFCVRFSDETWNVSSVMAEARKEKMNMNPKIYKVKRKNFSQIDKRKIVYRGYLIPFMGADLIVRAMPFILKVIPDAHLEIAGGGDQEQELKKIAKELSIEKSVKFYGFVRDRKKLEEILSDGALGIATFNTDILDDKVKNADPGKIKDYMLMGIPVITTNALYYHSEITKKKCGLVVDYKPEKLAEAVIKLLSNEKLLKQYRENALAFIKRFDCNTILKPNVERILNEA